MFDNCWLIDRLLPGLAIVLAALFLVFMLALPIYALLNDDTLDCGEVYEKEFLPASLELRWLPLTRYDPNSKTSHVQMQPYWVRKPDRYVVRIKAYKGEEWQYDEWYVPREVWDTVEIGSMFEAETKRGDSNKEPYTKTRAEG